MKYYETHFEEYCKAVDQNNYHPDLPVPMTNQVVDMTNQIFYGPTGCGKYSQALCWIRPFSPSKLKYDRKMTATTDKASYTYRISDIHYEVDMAMMGCNSKTLWETVFNQIVDIVSVRADKTAIILCKNFHAIQNELLDIFYSYMRQFKFRANLFNKGSLCIRYVLVTEHLSFIPADILRECHVCNMGRPSPERLRIGRSINARAWLREIEPEGIMNLKELRVLDHVDPVKEELPSDVFNKICNALLDELEHVSPERFQFLHFRDLLYNMTIYHLDILESLTYVLVNAVRKKWLPDDSLGPILAEIVVFLKWYNNNYRTIYHIERIFFFLFIQRLRYKESLQIIASSQNVFRLAS